MSWQNHLGVYLMLVYMMYMIDFIVHIVKNKGITGWLMNGNTRDDEWYFGFIIGLMFYIVLEIPYWIIYLCFIKYG